MHGSLLLLIAALSNAAPVDTTKIAFTGDLGLVTTSGNTTLTTTNIGEKIELGFKGWRTVQSFAVVYGRNDSVTTTSLWNGSLRGERELGSKVGVFVLGAWDRNIFAGVKSRTSPQVGVTAHLMNTTTDKLDLELGGGYTTLKGISESDNRDFASGRIAANYLRRLGDRTSLSQNLEYLPDFDQAVARRINYLAVLTAPIMAGLSLKTSYDIRFNGRPAAGFRRTDRILTTGVQVTF